MNRVATDNLVTTTRVYGRERDLTLLKRLFCWIFLLMDERRIDVFDLTTIIDTFVIFVNLREPSAHMDKVVACSLFLSRRRLRWKLSVVRTAGESKTSNIGTTLVSGEKFGSVHTARAVNFRIHWNRRGKYSDRLYTLPSHRRKTGRAYLQSPGVARHPPGTAKGLSRH